MWTTQRSLGAWPGLLLVALAGCNSNDPKIVEVTGTLTYKGNPMPNVLVTFSPESGRPSWGQTNENGEFKLNYAKGQDGALVGKHKVWVMMRQTSTVPGAEPGRPAGLSKDMTEFLDKYSQDKSTKEVKIDKNTKEVKLEWD
jgi:hypothetical protein